MSGFGDRLRAELGAPRNVKRLGSSPRSKVWWAQLPGGGAVVKQISGGADAAHRFQRELAALRLAEAADPRVVPRLLAADVDTNVIVLEYLDEGRPGPGWQLDYATALARLHACAATTPRRAPDVGPGPPGWAESVATAAPHRAGPERSDTAVPGGAEAAAPAVQSQSGPERSDSALFSQAEAAAPASGQNRPDHGDSAQYGSGPAAVDAAIPRWNGPDSEDAEDFLALATAWGVTVPGSAREELAALVGRLGVVAVPALLHGDPCPVGNVLYSDAGLRFIDLEQASIGDGLVELAYLRIGFPTCYSSPGTTPGLLRDAEDAYRDTWRAATGSAVTGGLADACAGWTIRGDALVERAHRRSRRHLRGLVDADWKWGKASARERLAFRLEVTAECAAAAEELAAVALVCRDLREAMRVRWPKLRRLTDPKLNYT